MKIADAVAALGYADDPDLGHLLFAIPTNGGWVHFKLDDPHLNGDTDTEDYPHVYLASGYFKPGRNAKSRTADNLGGVFTLPFDADLSDFLGLPKAAVYALAQPEIDEAVEAQLAAVVAAFRDVGLHWDRIDYTGHGLCAHVRVAPADRARVADLRGAHKRLVALLDAHAGFRLFDPQVSDAGTRIFRLVPGLNGKSNPPRRTRVLEETGRQETLERMEACGWALPAPAAPVARFDKALTDEDLLRVVDALTAAWGDGSRHLPALGIVGMLAKAGIKEADAVALLGGLGGDPDPRDREKVVRTTYDHVAAGRPVAGYTALRRVLPPADLAAVDAVLAKYRSATSPRIAVPPEAPAAPAPPADGMAPMPKAAAYGWFRAYADFMSPYSEAPWQYHVACALTVAGQVAARRAHVEWFGRPLYPNQYCLLVGRSGSARKDYAILKALELVTRSSAARMIAPPFRTLTDVASAEALFDALKDTPDALYYLTEFTDLVTKNERKGTGNLFDRLIQVWDNPVELQSNRRDNRERAEAPRLSILAGTQPGRLANAMAAEAIQSGFANRWLIVPGKADKTLHMAPRMDWDGFLALAWELRDALRDYEGDELVIADEAAGFYKDWYDRFAAEQRTEEEDDMRQRHAVLAFKAATVYAMADGASCIDRRHAEAAFALVDWMWAQLRVLMRTWGGNTENKIERRIKQALLSEGPMHRSALREKARGPEWGTSEFKRVFEYLRDEDVIACDPQGNVALRRPGGGVQAWA